MLSSKTMLVTSRLSIACINSSAVCTCVAVSTANTTAAFFKSVVLAAMLAVSSVVVAVPLSATEVLLLPLNEVEPEVLVEPEVEVEPEVLVEPDVENTKLSITDILTDGDRKAINNCCITTFTMSS